MNSEIKRLQNEIKKLRKQNLEKERQIKYIPLNIISNNLYINNSSKNNSNKNYLINKSKNLNSSSSAFNNNGRKNKSFVKLPFKKGMFSYKNSSIYSTPINYQNNNKGRNNNSLLQANLKLNLDSEDYYPNNLSQNISNYGRIAPSSSLDLNKYKITEKNRDDLLNSHRNIKSSAPHMDDFNNNIRKVKTNYNINNFFHKKNINNKSGLIINTNNLEYKKPTIHHNSVKMLKSPSIIPKLIINKEQNSSSLFNIDDYKDNSNLYSNKHSRKRKIIDHYVNNPKNEKESRRMIIELIKVLNRQNHKNNEKYMHGDVDAIMESNNISKKVLNKEYILSKEFNFSGLFQNNTNTNKNNKTFGDISFNKSSLSNSMINNFNDSVMNLSNKVLSKNFNSPIKSNINNFLTNMNDEKIDKINMIKFLSVPRIMKLNFLNNKYKFICFLCPNNISYINGIESYIFKFVDIRSYKLVGGFDLIKVNLCSVNNNNLKNFYIETYDGKTYRNYEFETSSKDIAIQYAKYISYLCQLEKCKIYNYKNINQ